MTKDQAAYYLAALFDGEGYVHYNPKGPRRVVIANTDQDILDAGIKALTLLDIQHRVYAKYRVLPEGRLPCFELTVYGRENLQMFYDLVPIQATRKKDKLLKVLSSYQRKTKRKTNEEFYGRV